MNKLTFEVHTEFEADASVRTVSSVEKKCLGKPWMRLLAPLIISVILFPTINVGQEDGSVLSPYGMVSLWKFDETSGTIAEDSVGINDGTVAGDTTWTAGKVNGGLEFNGEDGRVAIGAANDVALTETSPFSISAWINSNDTDRPRQVIASNYMGEGGGSGSYSTYLGISFRDNGSLIFALNNRQIAGDEIQTPISNGWHFVTATYDGSNMKLYVDGALEQTGTRSISGTMPNTRGWNIGDFSPETNEVHGSRSVFYGTLDEVALYDKALSETEINQLMSATSGDVSGDKETEAAIYQLPKCPMIKTPSEPNPLGAPLMLNPEIASGAKCRGACGEDCPSDRCKSVADVEIPIGDSQAVCVYSSVIECPTHQGCRDHDACYDRCAEEGHMVVFELPGGPDDCHSACNQACYDNWTKANAMLGRMFYHR